MRKYKSFTSLSVTNLEEASQFYSEKLELDPEKYGQQNVFFVQTGGDTRFMVYQKDDHQPANFTVLNFEVDDLEAVVEKLKDNQVKFESIEGTNEKGIAEMGGVKAAWTRDPSGNWIGFFQDPS